MDTDISARVDRRLSKMLEHVAKILGVSKSEIIRQAIINYLKELQETAFFTAMQNMQQQKRGDCYA